MGYHSPIEVRILISLDPAVYHAGADIHREHVYRRHELAIRCPRCKAPFEDEASVQEHLEMLESCQIIKSEELEGYNKEQERQLRSRRRPANQTEEDRWVEMYHILFPEDDQDSMPSPCKTHCILVVEGMFNYANCLPDYNLDRGQVQEHLTKFTNDLKGTLPKKMWADLQPDLVWLAAEERRAMEERIVVMVRECTDEFLQRYKEEAHGTPSVPSCPFEEPKPPYFPVEQNPITDSTSLNPTQLNILPHRTELYQRYAPNRGWEPTFDAPVYRNNRWMHTETQPQLHDPAVSIMPHLAHDSAYHYSSMETSFQGNTSQTLGSHYLFGTGRNFDGWERQPQLQQSFDPRLALNQYMEDPVNPDVRPNSFSTGLMNHSQYSFDSPFS
jgi:hypothetical protein